jgi:hypothetical protein
VPLNWQAGRHIKWLMNWIEDSVPAAELQKWRTRAAAMEDPRPTPKGILYRWRQLRRMLLLEPQATIPADYRSSRSVRDTSFTDTSYHGCTSVLALRLEDSLSQPASLLGPGMPSLANVLTRQSTGQDGCVLHPDQLTRRPLAPSLYSRTRQSLGTCAQIADR